MEKEVYINRIAEANLIEKLNSIGCVLVYGPKFCGKSTMCGKFAKSATYLITTAQIQFASADPKAVLEGETPHLIDERQKVPEIWNLIRADLDKNYQFGKYIITGSTTPVNPKHIQHSGAGRISSMILRTFSLYESKESTGLVSLKSLFDKNYTFKTVFPYENPVSIKDIAFYICRGGWPLSVITEDKKRAINITRNYFNDLFGSREESDDFAEFLKRKDIGLLKLILKSYARNISTQAKNTTMIKDILSSGERSKLDEDTFIKYTNILKQLFIIYDLPAMNLKLRSSVQVKTTPTHHFFDTSIATAALDILPDDLLNDFNSFGFFFEDLALRDLTIYAESFGAKLKHYVDSSGCEIDAIIQLPNSNYGAVEIKIASEENIKKGIVSLNRFEEKMKNNGLKTPSFKMLLTSHGAAYKTKDDVFVVPINMLKN